MCRVSSYWLRLVSYIRSVMGDSLRQRNHCTGRDLFGKKTSDSKRKSASAKAAPQRSVLGRGTKRDSSVLEEGIYVLSKA